MRLARFLAAILQALALGTGLHAVVWAAPPRPMLTRLKVAVTIAPLHDLVRQVAGPEVEVVLLAPPGASPHTFTATPSMIRSLTGSKTLFAIGHGLDDWASRLARDVGGSATVVVDANIPLREGNQAAHTAHPETHGPVDPHYWLAIPNAMLMVRTIATTLGQLDPAAREDYHRRAVTYRQRLQALDAAIRQQLAGCPQREIAMFHPAFHYFAAAYNLRIVATFEPSPGRESTPRHVAAFLRQLRAHHIAVLFVEPQLPQAPLQSLVRDWGVTLREIDPLGGTPGRATYEALMQFNAAQVAAVLCE